MAFPASNWFKKPFVDLMTGVANPVDFDTSTFNCALFTNSVDPGSTHSFDTNTGYSTTGTWCPTGGEISESGTNYNYGGVVCGSPTLAVSPAGTIKFDVADAVWTSSTITAQGCLLYRAHATYTKYGIVAVNFTNPVVSNNGNFEVRWNANGVLTFT